MGSLRDNSYRQRSFLEVEVYYGDARFYGTKSKQDKGREVTENEDMPIQLKSPLVEFAKPMN